MRKSPLLAAAFLTLPGHLPAQEINPQLLGIAQDNAYLVENVIACVQAQTEPAEDDVFTFGGQASRVTFAPNKWFEINAEISDSHLGHDHLDLYFWESFSEDRFFDGTPETSADGLDAYDFSTVEGLEAYREALINFLNENCLIA